MNEAMIQSAYDGAALVYGRNQALSYLGKSDPPGHAEVTTFTTSGSILHFFAHYTALSEDDILQYHQYCYASTILNMYKKHKEGRRGLRNEQDYAQERSYALRDQLKEHWKQMEQLKEHWKQHCSGLRSTFEELNGDKERSQL